MPLATGAAVGAYEVRATLGAGGMGEVYRARDGKLGRDVALKVLPAAFAADRDRMARFEREARLLASLNHPNIAAIYGLEDSAGVRALGGTVKILDFGLARALEPHPTGSELSQSPTLTQRGLTEAGIILGTAAYMAPEQAMGKAADVRSDIWAFGVVLFEMLTGRPVFAGETALELLSSALKTDPDWASLPEGTPPAVRSLLRRCLQKDRSRRLRDIVDARFQIEEAINEPTTPVLVGASGRKSRERIGWIVGSVAVAAVAVGATHYLSRPQAIGEEVRFEVATPPTTDPTAFAISPDGKKLVFEATSDGKSHLWLRSLDAVLVRPPAGTDEATSPFWLPDSRVIGFSANGQVRGINVDTRVVQPLARAGAWNQDGAILFSRGGGGPIYRLAANGGEPAPVTPILQGSDQQAPRFLPNGRNFLFTAQGGTTPGVYVALLGGSDPPRRIVNDAAVGAYSSGHLLFVRQGTLFAQRFDPVRLQLDGRVTTVADQVVTAGGRSFALSASEAGPIAYRTGPPAQTQFVWFDRSGSPLQAVAGSDIASGLNSSLSPDGRYLAISRNVGGEAADIWLLDLSRGLPTRFTDDPAFELTPVWSPDGRRIAYGSNRNGTFDLYVKFADRTGSENLLAGDDIDPPSDWSPDGQFILAAYEGERQQDIWVVPVDGDRKAFPVVESKTFTESGGQFSPDGKWIAFQSNESGRFEIYVQPFPGPGSRALISSDGGVQVRWRHDGQELFYLAPDNRLMAVRIQLDAEGGNVEADRPLPIFATRLPMAAATLNARHYMVSPDGQRFLMQTVKEVTLPITVILNFNPKP